MSIRKKGDSMYKKLLLIVALGVTLSGCFMVPLAFIGPATSGFTTASIAQSIVTHSANAMIKKSTGKAVQEHAFDSLTNSIFQQTNSIFQQTYFPIVKNNKIVNSK